MANEDVAARGRSGSLKIESDLSNEELAGILESRACRVAIVSAMAELESSGEKPERLKILKDEIQAHPADGQEIYSSVKFTA